MTYTPLKPDPGESPALDASIIQTNFAQFGLIFSHATAGVNFNHMPMNDVNQGKHAAVIFQNQTSDPGVIQGLTSLYAKNATSASAGTEPQIFAQIPKFLPTNLDTTTAPSIGMQLTFSSVNTVGPAQYQSFLVGGYIIYFGTVTAMPATITLSPVPTKIVLAIGEAQNFTNGSTTIPLPIATQILSASQFKMITSGPLPVSFIFSWVAIAQQ